MKVYLLIEITDYDCTDEEKILGVYSDYEKVWLEENRLKSLEKERPKSVLDKAPWNYFYEVREYEVIALVPIL